MKRSVIVAASGLAGFLLGSSVGIAFGGNAINGSYVVAAVFALVSFLSTGGIGKNVETTAIEKPFGSDQTQADKRVSDFSAAAAGVMKSMEHLLLELAVLFRVLWNLEMKFIEKIALMPMFKRFPWLFLVLGVILLVFFPPAGIIFAVTALCAASKEMLGENDFKVAPR